MEEDGGVRAPAARLRRRLSVEQDDTKSPSAPSTPTKKRGGRLAAKPQLELIEENDIQNSQKRTTRRSLARDNVDPVEEKSITPSRRSTRVKSNTSLLSETPQVLDSPRAKRAAARRTSQVGSDNEATVTPARTRRTRKDSTTSVDIQATSTSVSEAEAAVSPGKMRSARKDSAPNLDNQDDSAVGSKPSIIKEDLSEEPESRIRKSTETSRTSDDVENESNSLSNLRKSPRLDSKKGASSKSIRSDSENQVKDKSIVNIQISESSKSVPVVTAHNSSFKHIEDSKIDDHKIKKDRLSIPSINLIRNLDTEPKKKSSKVNKSTSAIENTNDSRGKRYRTNSCINLSVIPSSEGNFFSDNESSKKKLRNREKLSVKSYSEQLKNSEIFIKTSAKKKVKRLDSSSTADNKNSMNECFTSDKSETFNNSSKSNKENLLNRNLKDRDLSAAELFNKKPSSIIKSMVIMLDGDSDSNNDTTEKKIKDKLFDSEDQCVPVVNQHSENQDSLPDKFDANSMTLKSENRVFSDLNKNDEKLTNNNSCEPMDIDETIPENISFTENILENIKDNMDNKESDKSSPVIARNYSEQRKSKRKSSLSNSTSQYLEKSDNENKSTLILSQLKDPSTTKNSMSKSPQVYVNDLLSRSVNVPDTAKANMDNKESDKSSPVIARNYSEQRKSKRKSSLSNSTSQYLEKSDNENKSTLILSQLKDPSTAENSMSKSPQVYVNDLLSRSVNVPDTAKGLSENLASHSTYSTSTPVHQKDGIKMAIQINTSVITPNNNGKITKIREPKHESKREVSVTSKNSDSSVEESEEEKSKEDSNLMDDEAEDAGDDYESGDSQDEDELQYERENEIPQMGETLISEDEISNDSDYEKDSFLVSSDEEDNELLSASGDDLEMSDNELTMSVKSKKKYNERKLKEQKKASREMFEARHKLHNADKRDEISNPKKNNRQRLDSTLLESEDEMPVPPKKNRRLRLESTLESEVAEQATDKIQLKNTGTHLSVSDTEEIEYKMKKKTKRLSELSCNESAINEREITLCDGRTIQKEDPLLVAVKLEPKTPQRDFNISTIHFTDREEVEEIQVDENVTMIKPNECLDPLQATMVQDEDESDSVSENEEIAANYDSILQALNKETKLKIKSRDISLNLNKKAKQKSDDPIVEQLNLTLTKKSKARKKSEDEDKKLETAEKSRKSLSNEEYKSDEGTSSSDSIDLRLLISEESNDNDINQNDKTENNGVPKQFGPLNNTTDETIIHGNVNKDGNSSLLNISAKKNKTKLNTSLNDETTISDDKNGGNVNFFFDTTGALEPSVNSSFNSSSKKKKNKSRDVSFVQELEPVTDDKANGVDSVDAPTEVSFQSKKNKKAKKVSVHNEDCSETIDKKKKKKISKHEEPSESEADKVTKSVTVASEQKRKRKPSQTNSDDDLPDDTIPVLEISKTLDEPLLDKNPKKKRKVSHSDQDSTFQKDSGSLGSLKENTKQIQDTANANKKYKKIKRQKNSGIEVAATSSTDTKTESKKRKRRDDDDRGTPVKVFKENSVDKVHIARLPASVIKELEDKPRKQDLMRKKSKVTSTAHFVVQPTNRRNKPSKYVEEVVCLNDDAYIPIIKARETIKKYKVLPFLPMASTSFKGFTTNFQVEVNPQKMEFVAKRSDVPNYRDDYIMKNRLKKLRTNDIYKKHRNVKLTKF